MRHFVVYHNPDVMCYPALDVGRLEIYTNKKRSDAVGGRVWLITDEGEPSKYLLRLSFLVESVDASDQAKFCARVTGKEGNLFHPMPALNGEPWFPQFIKRQGNLSFGFHPINDPLVEAGLQRFIAAAAK